MVCDECHGRGSNAGVEIEVCRECLDGYEPCKLHKCRQCDGSGAVCPLCRGMRFVRERAWDARYGGGYIRVSNKVGEPDDRCPKCMEGNNVNRRMETQAINKYLLRWRSEYDPEHDVEAERRAERDAYQAEWRANSGPNRWERQRRKRSEQQSPPEEEGDA